MKIYLYCVPYSWGRHNDVIGYALAENGEGLASHLSSNREWAMHDMGLTSNWKHEHYDEIFPNGYELEWIEYENLDNHAGFQEALRLNREQHPE